MGNSTSTNIAHLTDILHILELFAIAFSLFAIPVLFGQTTFASTAQGTRAIRVVSSISFFLLLLVLGRLIFLIFYVQAKVS